jgi:hypothetical protein
MKKIDLGQLVIVLANLGVVVGLVLVAIEISQANRQAAATAYQARTSEVEQARKDFALSEQLPRIYVELNENGLESLSPEDRSRLTSWEAARMLRMQGQHRQFLLGFLDPAIHQDAITAAAERGEFWRRLGIYIPDPSFRAAVQAASQDVESLEEFDDAQFTSPNARP